MINPEFEAKLGEIQMLIHQGMSALAQAERMLEHCQQRWRRERENVRWEAAGPVVNACLTVVSARYSVGRDLLLGPSRKQRHAWARHVAMYLIRTIAGEEISYPTIGNEFNRDHSTILYAVDSVQRRADREPEFARFLASMCSEATGMLAQGEESHLVGTFTNGADVDSLPADFGG